MRREAERRVAVAAPNLFCSQPEGTQQLQLRTVGGGRWRAWLSRPNGSSDKAGRTWALGSLAPAGIADEAPGVLRSPRAGMAERQTRSTQNRVGNPRAGSNPAPGTTHRNHGSPRACNGPGASSFRSKTRAEAVDIPAGAVSRLRPSGVGHRRLSHPGDFVPARLAHFVRSRSRGPVSIAGRRPDAEERSVGCARRPQPSRRGC